MAKIVLASGSPRRQELLQRIGAQEARRGIFRVGEDEGIGDFGHPAVLAFFKVLSGLCEHLIRAAEVFHPLLGSGRGHEGIEMHGVALSLIHI